MRIMNRKEKNVYFFGGIAIHVLTGNVYHWRGKLHVHEII